MQKIRSVLKIGSTGVALCDTFGSSAGAGLELMLGTGALLEFELRGEAVGESAALPDYPLEELANLACYFALDFECVNSSTPPLLILDGITVRRDDNGRTVLAIPLVNNAAENILNALKERNTVEFVCEIGGVDGSGNYAFAWQFPLTVRSRVYIGDGNPSLPPQVLYYTADQINGIIAGLEGKIVIPSAGEVKLDGECEFFPGMDVESALQSVGAQLAGVQSELEGI